MIFQFDRHDEQAWPSMRPRAMKNCHSRKSGNLVLSLFSDEWTLQNALYGVTSNLMKSSLVKIELNPCLRGDDNGHVLLFSQKKQRLTPHKISLILNLEFICKSMDGLEFNKIAAAVLIAGIIVMIVSNIADILYQPQKTFPRGYQIAIETTTETNQVDTKPEEPVDIALLMAKADATKGKDAAKRCTMCHTFTQDGKNKVGPNLWGIAGAKKVYRNDYTYSKAMISKGGIWSREDLFYFITNPKKFLPGTKMSFAGYANPQEVANVIKYLETLK